MADSITQFPLPPGALIAVDRSENGGFSVEIWDWPALAGAGGNFPTLRDGLLHALDLSESHGLPYAIFCDFEESMEVRHG